MSTSDRLRRTWAKLKDTAARFIEIDPFTQAGFLAYTTIFAIPGVIILVLAVAGFFYDADQVRHALYAQAQGFIGADTTDQLQRIVAHSDKQKSGLFAKVLGILALVFSATAAFTALQRGLNKVWRIPPVKGRAITHYLLARVVSLALIAAFGFLLLMSLVVDTVLVAVGERVGNWLPAHELLIGILGALVSFGVVTLIFALVFKLLPDTKVPWRSVWTGALFTALLFTLGKFLIGLYIAKTGAGDAYGAGGAVVVLMLWAYFSSLILLFGAQYSYVSSGAGASKGTGMGTGADTRTGQGDGSTPRTAVGR
jgi:membrane protein